jgi:hypothetical protein
MQSRDFLMVFIEVNVCLQIAAVTDQILQSLPTNRKKYSLVQCISVYIFIYQSHTHTELSTQGFQFILQKWRPSWQQHIKKFCMNHLLHRHVTLLTIIYMNVHMLIRTCKLAFDVTHLPPTAKHEIISCFEGNILLVFWSLLSSYIMEFCKRIKCIYSTTHEAEFPTRN